MFLRRRVASLILIISLLLSLCPAAFAEVKLTITSDTRVYAEPDTSSSSYSVKKGWEAILVAYGKGSYSDWARIKNPTTGKIFYIKTRYLSESGEEAPEEKTDISTAYILVDGLYIYKEKSLSSGHVRSLTRGRQVTVYSESNGWAKIEYKGKEGYVPAAALSDEKPSSVKRMYTNKETTAFLSDNSFSAELASFNAGKEVKVYAAEGDWYIVSVPGGAGYIRKSHLQETKYSPEKPEEESVQTTSAYVLVDGLSIYKEKSLSSSRVRSLTRGRQVTVFSESGGWAKIDYKGKQGYVPAAALSDEKPSSIKRMYTNTETCAYLSDTTSSAELASFKAGAEVKVYAAEGDWYIVSVSGGAGYVRKAHLQETKYSPEKPEEESAQTTSAYILVDGLYIYKEKSLSSSHVRSLTRGRQVTVYSESDGWAKMEYKGKQGYVPVAALSDEKPADVKRMYTNKDTCAYLNTTSSSDELASFKIGEEVKVYAANGDWYVVAVSGGAGYIRASDLSANKVSAGYESVNDSCYVKSDVAKVYIGESSDSAVAFQLGYGTKISVRGLSVDGKWAKIRYNSNDYYMLCSALSNEPVKNDIILADWFNSNINSTFKKGTRATITDVDTGLTWTVVRRGSTNHADVEPISDADTAIMQQAVAGEDGNWTYIRHAVIVTINGKRYAASIYTEPHGDSSVSANDYSGHFCVHFLNSRTHGTDRVDEGHQKMVMKAYNAF